MSRPVDVLAVRITNRERMALQPAILYGWEIEIDTKGRALWDADNTLPFRAHKSLESLISKKLMARVMGGVSLCGSIPHGYYRITPAGLDYKCRADGCHGGKLMEPDEHDCFHIEVGKCKECDGTGVTLIPHAALSAVRPQP